MKLSVIVPIYNAEKFLNQCNGKGSEFCLKQHTEKAKEKISKIKRELYDETSEQGRKVREKMSKSQKTRFDINTEEGRKNRELDRISTNKQFDINTEEGRKNRENHRNLTLKQFDINTEEGRERRKAIQKHWKEYFNPETELGRLHLQENRERQKELYNINTEEGIRNREKAKERAKVAAQKSAKTRVQKRKDTSILGELMFDEDFIRQNLLITDNKNNLRFLWSVYSKLTGYSECFTRQQKQNGKISFLSGIKSIKLSEKDENAKIKEIEQLLKSRNNEKE